MDRLLSQGLRLIIYNFALGMVNVDRVILSVVFVTKYNMTKAGGSCVVRRGLAVPSSGGVCGGWPKDEGHGKEDQLYIATQLSTVQLLCIAEHASKRLPSRACMTLKNGFRKNARMALIDA